MEKTTVSFNSIRKTFREELKNDYDMREIDQFLSILLNEWKGWNRAQAQLYKEDLFSQEETNQFLHALEELKHHKPIQYITGKTYFHDMELVVGPGVLIPRPETEELVELIIRENIKKSHDELSVLDIGTGSGCIALGLKKKFPEWAVSTMDNSMKALEVARKNATMNKCDICFITYDIFQKPVKSIFPLFDIIISNPPYITESEKKWMKKNVLEFEPAEALFVPDNDPLVYYKAITDFARKNLVRPGFLYLEINERFGPEIKKLLLTKGFSRVDIIKDIIGKDRFIKAET
jgi:release factor glutamine methyltransferase